MTMKMLLATGILLASAPSLWAQTQYTGYGDPTSGEQYALELINRARANPTAEGTRLGINPISEGFTAAEAADVGPRPPLTMNSILLGIARAHSQDMWTRNYFDHDDIPPGNSGADHWPWDRATDAGYNWNQFSENIASGSNHTPAALEDVLMIDSGYAGRGHRKNLLDVDDTSSIYMREIGVGYYSGMGDKSNVYRDVLTEDFGRRNAVGPFVVGVVYNDTNANNFYDPGEGLAGVTVRLNPAGASYAVTASQGGYAFLANTSAAITVEATGGPFGSAVVSKTVTPGFPGENVKIDFKLSEATLTDSDADGLPDAWETAHFGNLSQTASGDPDGDGFTNLAEFNGGSDPMSAASTPGTGTPPPSSGKKGKGGGGCGLTGLEAVLALLLLRRRR